MAAGGGGGVGDLDRLLSGPFFNLSGGRFFSLRLSDIVAVAVWGKEATRVFFMRN